MKKILYSLLILHLSNSCYEINPEKETSLFSTKTDIDPINQIAQERYRSSWFFKQKRQEKYQRLAHNLDHNVQTALIDHLFNNNAPNDQLTLDKVNNAIKNLKSNKHFTWSNDNFSAHLLYDLQKLSNKISDNVTEANKREHARQQEVLKKHQATYDRINESKMTQNKESLNIVPNSSFDSNMISDTHSSDSENDENIKPISNYKQKFAKIDFEQKLQKLNQEEAELNQAMQAYETKITKLNKKIQYQQSTLHGINMQIEESNKNNKLFTDFQIELNSLPKNAEQYRRKINLIANIANIKPLILSSEHYEYLQQEKINLEASIPTLLQQEKELRATQEELKDQMYDLNIQIKNTQHKQKLVHQ